ncbi:hypothetical protein [Kineosporia sp. NBRC 101677]|uniref:hypothetical protein n=1 Tax=Kineosporia sp. NBRC 101677 TaxID=3032197 RepID=UPI0025529B10|nr:hypothetical protein [Kineosporia sp. NBRC 101677]
MPVQRVAADSCPGVLRPHQAADGALARLRAPGGALTVDALRGLRAVAEELADGRLGLTSRGNLQVRGVDPASVGRLEARLAGLGLLPHPTHERVRNIVASPLAGCGFGSIEDVGELVPSLDAALCARADLVELPGRFLFGLDDGTGDIAGEEPDVLIRAAAPGRFEVCPLGASAGVTVGRAQVVEAALVAATAFLAERARQESKAWRVDELPGGAAAVITALLTAGHPEADDLGAGRLAASVVTPGLTEQRDGRFAVCAVVPLGILDGEQMDALAACCEMATDEGLAEEELLDGYPSSDALLDGTDFPGAEPDGFMVAGSPGSTPLRITPWRRVVVRDLELPAALAAQELLAAVGLVVEPESPWARITACAGQPGCAKSRTDVQADARAFATISAPDGPAVHWAGCDRGCGTPHAAVALLAAEGGYRVNGELPESDRNAAASSSIGLKDEPRQ